VPSKLSLTLADAEPVCESAYTGDPPNAETKASETKASRTVLIA
jgi:hypothetical protein